MPRGVLPVPRPSARTVPAWVELDLEGAYAEALASAAPADAVREAADHAARQYPTLRDFMRRTAPQLAWYRHVEVLAGVLEDVAAGRKRRVLLSVPPRHGKSELVSRTFAAWWLLRHPDQWVGLASYGAELAQQLSRAARDRYTLAGGAMRDDSQAVNLWQTPYGGGMWAAGVGGAITGFGADLAIIDDPLKNAEEAASPLIRSKQQEWYQSVLATRLHPDAAVVVVQTRWHEDDLTGWLLRLEAERETDEGWHIVHLPALADEVPPVVPVGCTVEPDWRQPGDALNPERYPASVLDATRRRVGPYVWAALYQGRPQALEGGLFLREWWGTYDPDALPSTWDTLVQSWDLTFKDADGSDYVAGLTIGVHEHRAYVLDAIRARMDFPATVRAIQLAAKKWPQAQFRMVEDAANGPAVLATLRGRVPHLVAVKPMGGKLARAHAIAPVVADGRVLLPPTEAAGWVAPLLEELTAFPTGAHDDQVDALTQGLRVLLPLLREPAQGAPLPKGADDRSLGLVRTASGVRPKKLKEAIAEHHPGRGRPAPTTRPWDTWGGR